MDTLSEALEERGGIRDSLDIGGGVQPNAEHAPLALGGGSFPVGCGRETLSKHLFLSMEVSCRLNMYGRGDSCQFFCCGDVRLKWRRKSHSYRYVRRDFLSAIFLAYTCTRPMEA